MRALGPALTGLLVLVLAGCGSSFAEVQSKNPAHLADGLVFTRADGSTYELEDAVATCTRSEVTGTEYVYLTALDDHSRHTGFVLQVVAGVTGERELPLRDRLPARRLEHRQGPTDLSLLAADPRTGSRFLPRGSQAHGLVSVTEASCDPEPRLTFQIDATLLAANGRPVRVKGGLATVT